MDNLTLSKSTENLAENNFIKFISAILVLLITFNLSWLLLLIKACFRLASIRNLTRAFINLESILILGNLSILILFLACVFSIRSVRGILGRKI